MCSRTSENFEWVLFAIMGTDSEKIRCDDSKNDCFEDFDGGHWYKMCDWKICSMDFAMGTKGFCTDVVEDLFYTTIIMTYVSLTWVLPWNISPSLVEVTEIRVDEGHVNCIFFLLWRFCPPQVCSYSQTNNMQHYIDLLGKK